MSALKLEATIRTDKGKNNAGRLRRAGSIPANLIGIGGATTVQVKQKAFDKMLQEGLRQSQVIEFSLDNTTEQVIVKEVQREPVTGQVQHIDFFRVQQGQKALVNIAVETTGVSIGVKTGGALEHFVRSLKVKAVPESFKECITVDITNLDVNDSVKLSDLDLPDAWEILREGNPLILKVSAGRMQSDEDDEDSAVEGEEAKTEEETETKAETKS